MFISFDSRTAGRKRESLPIARRPSSASAREIMFWRHLKRQGKHLSQCGGEKAIRQCVEEGSQADPRSHSAALVFVTEKSSLRTHFS